MDCRTAREILLGISGQIPSGSERKEAWAHLASCIRCQASLSRLGEDLRVPEPMCAFAQEMLPLYVEEELAAKPVQATYPVVWQHIQECPTCTRAHDELLNLLRSERAGGQVEPESYPRFALPFLSPQSPADKAVAWTVETLRDAQGRLSAVITISKTYILNVLFPQAPVWARSGESVGRPAERVPLMDSLLEEGPWLVSVEMLRPTEAGAAATGWQLRVSLAGSEVPAGTQVRIRSAWGERIAPIDEHGEAIFRDVPLGWLSEDRPESAEEQLRVYIEHIPV
ncbi:MAG TPA: hypothetical protein VIK33_13665 [Anaerolineae bacterium]